MRDIARTTGDDLHYRNQPAVTSTLVESFPSAVYTLPQKISFRIRRPGRPLLKILRSVCPEYRTGKIAFEVRDWLERRAVDGSSTVRWYCFATGEKSAIKKYQPPFEIEPSFGLFLASMGDLTIHLQSFTGDPETVMLLDIARDALLAGRDDDATRIAREALPHGWPLFIEIVRRERLLLAGGGSA